MNKPSTPQHTASFRAQSSPQMRLQFFTSTTSKIIFKVPAFVRLVNGARRLSLNPTHVVRARVGREASDAAVSNGDVGERGGCPACEEEEHS